VRGTSLRQPFCGELSLYYYPCLSLGVLWGLRWCALCAVGI